ncbi:RICIN domain-containing protein [Kitasatospora sp. NPDC058170]|uniref:RICIN domain-containing protein n=1 Tax=Kitasatospora sp. NPDC058170 TaxID=3346364 RepID=UPI0036DDE354
MGFTAGRSYVIRNRRSCRVLNVMGNGTNQGATLDTWELQQDGRRPSQVWHLFPLDQGSALLANKNSGQVVSVRDNSTAPSEEIEQAFVQADRIASQSWMVREAPGGGYHIVNKRSGLYLNLHMNNTMSGTRAEQYYFINDPVACQVWDLEVEDEYKTILDLQQVDTGPDDIGDILRLTDFRRPAKSTTERVLIGQVALPFPLVDDPGMSAQERAQRSPYYLLKRYGSWKMVYYYEHSGASGYTKTQEIKVGLTTTNSSEVNSTTGISVTANAGFSFSGLTASLSSTVSYQLQVTTDSSTSELTQRTETVSRSYPAGKRISEAIWYRDNTFILERLDGTEILEWTVRDSGTCITDAYPD